MTKKISSYEEIFFCVLKLKDPTWSASKRGVLGSVDSIIVYICDSSIVFYLFLHFIYYINIFIY